MAAIVAATQQETGLECLSVPFCMTVEAEALGCRIDMGSASVLPHIAAEVLRDISRLMDLPAFDAERSGRAPVVLEALRILAQSGTPYPVIGAVVGPVSLAAMVMEAGIFLRLTRRTPAAAEALVRAMERVTTAFALAQRAAGADCILIAEPSATGEVLGAAHFARYALPSLSGLLQKLHQHRSPAILHICGELRPILDPLRVLAEGRAAPLAVSVDSIVTGRVLRDNLPGCVCVGNIDAVQLERGPVSAIRRAARRAARDFDIVSPACGLVPSTPARHLAALVEVIQHGNTRSQA